MTGNSITNSNTRKLEMDHFEDNYETNVELRPEINDENDFETYIRQYSESLSQTHKIIVPYNCDNEIDEVIELLIHNSFNEAIIEKNNKDIEAVDKEKNVNKELLKKWIVSAESMDPWNCLLKFYVK